MSVHASRGQQVCRSMVCVLVCALCGCAQAPAATDALPTPVKPDTSSVELVSGIVQSVDALACVVVILTGKRLDTIALGPPEGDSARPTELYLSSGVPVLLAVKTGADGKRVAWRMASAPRPMAAGTTSTVSSPRVVGQ
jgi:hypothetical protein